MTTVNYIETPPTRDEIKDLLRKLRVPVRGIVRTSEPIYAEIGLSDGDVDDDVLLDALIAYPILLQRPIVVAGDHAVLGRPPENVNSLVD